MENKGCKICGKRLPTRNNQVSFACQRHKLCKSCYLKSEERLSDMGIVIESEPWENDPEFDPWAGLEMTETTD